MDNFKIRINQIISVQSKKHHQSIPKIMVDFKNLKQLLISLEFHLLSAIMSRKNIGLYSRFQHRIISLFRPLLISTMSPMHLLISTIELRNNFIPIRVNLFLQQISKKKANHPSLAVLSIVDHLRNFFVIVIINKQINMK